ncbi:MAG: hypothetical protein ACI9MR_004967 [Myxococcota bacterium]|jgi:hypothetical protein
MVLLLAEALGLPHRDQNELLAAAGFAPAFQEGELSSPALGTYRAALDFLMTQHEPFPVVLLDHQWNLRGSNNAAQAVMGHFIHDPEAYFASHMPNSLRLAFDPNGVRPYITNWDTLAPELLRWVQRELLVFPAARKEALLASLLAYPGVPNDWRVPDLLQAPSPVVSMKLERDGLALNTFALVTRLGTAADVTLQELSVETFYRADEATKAAFIALAAE